MNSWNFTTSPSSRNCISALRRSWKEFLGSKFPYASSTFRKSKQFVFLVSNLGKSYLKMLRISSFCQNVSRLSLDGLCRWMNFCGRIGMGQWMERNPSMTLGIPFFPSITCWWSMGRTVSEHVNSSYNLSFWCFLFYEGFQTATDSAFQTITFPLWDLSRMRKPLSPKRKDVHTTPFPDPNIYWLCKLF